MLTASYTKYGFRIRTRHGLVVENLLIHGADERDAERKVRQMYAHCEILECIEHQPERKRETSFEEVLTLISQ